LPPSPHANSVCLPTWNDVVDYEKAEPRVLQRLQTGYPRFFIHPLTLQLFGECARRFAGADEFCHVYPSRAAAQRSIDSVRRWSGHVGRLAACAEAGPFVTCFPRAAEEAARKHWRHSGDGISSRHAQALLQGRSAPNADVAKQAIRQQIARVAGVPADRVYLFSSGMSGIYAVYRAINRLFPGRRSVQFGFPYVDTLKLQQDLGPGAHFFPRGGEQDLRRLRKLLSTEPISAIFSEFPSNPLLVSPDLAALAELAERHEFPLVVDETLGTYVNVDLRSVADVLVTSLTKYFTGAGDVLGGAAIVNPRGHWSTQLGEALAGEYEETLWADDAVHMSHCAADFPERVARINRTAEQVCDFCQSHPAIAEVYYPKFHARDHYAAFQRAGGGYGGLFSILLQDPVHTTAPFFDALRLCKGPNLGTYFSLCCPFTLLAHYQELDWAESCGVSRYLIRVSVGLEEARDLIQRLDDALPSV
jgi:cystathionine gamma-synthase